MSNSEGGVIIWSSEQRKEVGKKIWAQGKKEKHRCQEDIRGHPARHRGDKKEGDTQSKKG